MNYQWRVDGQTTKIRLFGTSVNLHLPAHVNQIIVDDSAGWADSAWSLTDGRAGNCIIIQPGEPVRIPENTGRRIFIRRESNLSQARTLPGLEARTKGSFILRRALTEVRDRLMLG
jgi:hypothetical protein